MPFTPTHVVAILPFARARLFPFSALAIGAMIPDLPLFFPGVEYGQTHSAIGVLSASLPLGLVAFWFFQLVLREPLVDLAPSWARRRLVVDLTPLSHRSFVGFLGVALAVTLGSYTHVFWDEFTHRWGWGVQWLDPLSRDVAVAGTSVPVYKLLQYGSSLLGLPVLMWSLWRKAPRSQDRIRPSPRGLKPASRVVVLAVVFIVPSLVGIAGFTSVPKLQDKLFEAVTSSAAAFLIVVSCYSVLFHIRSNRYVRP